MAKKQRKLRTVIKPYLISIILLIQGYSTCLAQSYFTIKEPLSIKCLFSSKDSILSIKYLNTSNQQQLIWVGDFLSGAIFTQHDVSSTDLASPISHQLFLFKKNINVKKQIFSYFFRSDTISERLLKNYYLLDKDSVLIVKIKIANKELVNQFKSKKLFLKGFVSVVDARKLDVYLNFDRERSIEDKALNQLDIFDSSLNYFNSDKSTVLSDLAWTFNRRDTVIFHNDMPIHIPKTAQFSDSSLHKVSKVARDSLKLPALLTLYRLTYPFSFKAEIR